MPEGVAEPLEHAPADTANKHRTPSFRIIHHTVPIGASMRKRPTSPDHE